MSENDNNQHPSDETDTNHVAGNTAKGFSDGRRRALKVAAKTAPVILTLSSRPAHAVLCGSAALQSANLSNHDMGGCACGFSPGAWKTPDKGNGDGSRAQWNAAGYDPGTRTCVETRKNGRCKSYKFLNGTTFQTAFSPDGMLPSGCPPVPIDYSTVTLMDILEWHGPPHNDPHNYGSHIVAALLNARYFASIGQDYALKEYLVREIHRQIVTNGSYLPASGTPMYPEDIVAWIQGTFCS
jgi:hypothetical protein